MFIVVHSPLLLSMWKLYTLLIIIINCSCENNTKADEIQPISFNNINLRINSKHNQKIVDDQKIKVIKNDTPKTLLASVTEFSVFNIAPEEQNVSPIDSASTGNFFLYVHAKR